MSKKSKLIVIVGPTASGKSELAVQIAKKFDGEIISGDSRQVYRSLDIGTGKVPGRWRRGKFIYKSITHHCIDFVSPKRTFTVAEYKKSAEAAIRNILVRGKIPIIAGGSGFWIDAVVFDMDFPEVPPNRLLRKQLENRGARELLKTLIKLDPERAKTIEQKNPRRLIRAIEVAKALGKVPLINKKERYKTTWIGLNPDARALEQKITRRTAEMLKNGLISETKKLLKSKIPRKRIGEFGFEHKAALDYLNKKISLEEIHPKLVRDTLQYVRRQVTWFKRNKKINWVEEPSDAFKLAKAFIQPSLRSK